MKIKSKLTGKEQTVSGKDWDIILGRGDGNKYTVIDKSETEAPAAPADLPKNYKRTVQAGDKALKEGRLVDALESYVAANEIKPSDQLTETILKIEADIKATNNQ